MGDSVINITNASELVVAIGTEVKTQLEAAVNYTKLAEISLDAFSKASYEWQPEIVAIIVVVSILLFLSLATSLVYMCSFWSRLRVEREMRNDMYGYNGRRGRSMRDYDGLIEDEAGDVFKTVRNGRR